METLSQVFKAIGEMLGAVLSVIPKVLMFILWAALALVILPCVFVAGNIYPAWEKWGEKF